MLSLSNSFEAYSSKPSNILTSNSAMDNPTLPFLTSEPSKESEGSTKEETPFAKLCYALSPLMSKSYRFQARQSTLHDVSPFDVNFTNDDPEIAENYPKDSS